MIYIFNLSKTYSVLLLTSLEMVEKLSFEEFVGEHRPNFSLSIKQKLHLPQPEIHLIVAIPHWSLAGVSIWLGSNQAVVGGRDHVTEPAVSLK